jgi:hypothetical protein
VAQPVRSVLARRLRPRSVLVSTGSAKCVTAPERPIARHNEQPARACLHRDTNHPAGKPDHPVLDRGRRELDLPTGDPPVAVSSAPIVICRRRTSNPATIAPGSSPSTNGAQVTTPASPALDAIPSLTVGPPASNDRRRGLQPRTPSTQAVQHGGRPPAAGSNATPRTAGLLMSSSPKAVVDRLAPEAPLRPVGAPNSSWLARSLHVSAVSSCATAALVVGSHARARNGYLRTRKPHQPQSAPKPKRL